MTSTAWWRKHTSPTVLDPNHDSQARLLPAAFLQWFAARGWAPRAHQLALLAKARDARSALLIAPTGAGKTLAGFLPSLVELSHCAPERSAEKQLASTGRGVTRSRGLHTLY